MSYWWELFADVKSGSTALSSVSASLNKWSEITSKIILGVHLRKMFVKILAIRAANVGSCVFQECKQHEEGRIPQTSNRTKLVFLQIKHAMNSSWSGVFTFLEINMAILGWRELFIFYKFPGSGKDIWVWLGWMFVGEDLWWSVFMRGFSQNIDSLSDRLWSEGDIYWSRATFTGNPVNGVYVDLWDVYAKFWSCN